MLRVVAAALIAAAALAPAVEAVDPTWIGVGGPRDWAPRPGYVLELDGKAWRIDALNGGGVTSLPLASRTVVRVRRLPDCLPVVRFVAVPGRDYFIRFAADGSARVEDWTGQGMDSGPALGDPGAPVCPALPDTSSAMPTSATGTNLPFVAAAAGVLTGILAFAGALRHQRHRREGDTRRPEARTG
jgi:hypothetical protein